MTYEQVASEVVDGKIVIDWTKGPSDAKFYTPETYENYETFLKVEQGEVYVIHMKNDDDPKWRVAFFDSVKEMLEDESVIAKESE
ncbi:hypothetical protein [Pseudomonas phage vB_PseuGesM_254]|uniref:Uncharacterized protein n=1 Tax=Pseudomonas phage vB_PseuGesM_254 TaxID=3092638 RepID=A0AAX4G784_9CAUD|nr:hypothetical protein [Pseudomonas phage PseuGes_254]